jgi:hypothetical protein
VKKGVPIILSLLFMLFIYVLLFRGLFIKGKLLDNQLKDKTGDIATYKGALKDLPMIDITPILMERKRELESIYRDYVTHLEIHSTRNEALSNIERPGLYFKEELHKVCKELKQESEEVGVQIPLTLGFDERVPQDEEVPDLLYKLEIAKVLSKNAITNKVTELSTIEFTKDGKGDPGQVFKEIPIRLKINADTTSVLNFLDSIQEDGQFFAIKSLNIKSTTGGKVDLEVLVSGIIFRKYI